jgi:DNA-binding transcriptional MerR regulator
VDTKCDAADRGAGGPAELLTIGAFARRSRISPRALRLYERQGLLIPAAVNDDNGYRFYRLSQLDTARLIVLLRRLDMPLRQVAELVAAPSERAAVLLAAYWESVERRNDSQRVLARHLQARLDGEQPPAPVYQVAARTVQERTYLVEQHHVLIGALPERIQTVATRMMALADAYAARAGEFMFVYHGEVTEDSDGPVEVCLPVDADAAGKAGLTSRVEPAHQQAYVRLRTSQTRYPHILSAYDAVFDWVAQHHRRPAGPPREMYLSHYPDAGPDDEICDVALPFR